jgi:tellurite resistance protein
MRDAALLIFALLLLGGVILLLMYLRYRHSPAVLWRTRVAARRSELRARRHELLATPVSSPIAQLADELFARHLRTVPVAALLSQPGIGPATVDKLQAAGWQAIPDVQLNQLDALPGLGAAKAAEVRAAVRQVTADARGRFDAGACPEGVEFRRRVGELTTMEQSATDDRTRLVTALDAAITKMDALTVIAKDVSFWNSLFFQKVPGLTDAVLHAELPLPDLTPRPPDPPVSPTRERGADHLSAQELAPRSRVGLTSGRGEETVSTPAEPPSVSRLRAVCRFGILVAKADGRMANAEKTVLRSHLGQAFASDAVALRFIDVAMEEVGKAALNEADVIAGVKDFAPAERRELLALANRISSAAGQVSAKEQQLLARLQAALGEPAPVPPPPAATDPRTVLDIPPDAELSPELIRRRFAFLSEKADPTKAAGLGAEFAAMAERKRAELKAAAETLLAPFGVPLEAPPPPPPPTDLRHNPDLDAVFGL